MTTPGGRSPPSSSSFSSSCFSESVLYDAAEESNLEGINLFADKRPDMVSGIINNLNRVRNLPGWKSEYIGTGAGNSALHVACWTGRSVEIVRRLLELGSDIAVKSDRGCLPLQLASYSGNLDIIKLLIASGCDTNAKDMYLFSAMHEAAQGGHRAVVEFLHSCGADINAQDREGGTPLHVAAEGGKLDVIEFLLDAGANPKSVDSNRSTCLQYASYRGRKEVVELLLKRGMSPTTGADSNLSEYSSLHWSAYACHVEIVQMLLDHGADVNAKTKLQETAITFACRQGHTDIVKVLLASGASTAIVPSYPNSGPFRDAFTAGRADILSILNNWPTTMCIILLEDLFIYNQVDSTSFCDLFEFIGCELFPTGDEDLDNDH